MAKTTPKRPQKKPRGRSAISNADQVSPTHPGIPQVQRTQASRPVKAGTGKHRGDRRDMSPLYTGNKKHAARGNSTRPDVKTRKR